MAEPRGTELIARYRANYGLPPSTDVTEAMVLEHWRLERLLTDQLLASTPATRAAVFERCYGELYSSLPWLRAGSEDGSTDRLAEHAAWPLLIGPPPRDVYEVGSGDGSLARYLARLGYNCRATEITSERGDRTPESGLTWTVTDGVNLDALEAPRSFDAVISDQVLEHLHPEDLSIHLRSARALLRPGGRIAFATPHAYTGPHDISRVFALDAPRGMHLHEYTYRELAPALQQTGFTDIRTLLRLPAALRARFGNRPAPIISRAYLSYLTAIELPLGLLEGKRRRRATRALRWALFPSGNLVMVATAPGP
jgi:SAM-dependent methyltransferase